MFKLLITTAVCGVALSACDGGDSTSTPVTSTPVTSTPVTSTPVTSTPVTSTPVTSTPLTSINGNWSEDCFNIPESSNSAEVDITLVDGSGSGVARIYTGDNCVPVNFTDVETETFTYTLGNLVTVDGSVLGITNATQLTSTDTTVGSDDFGDVEFDLVAISGDQLVFGDTDGGNDGSTEALRATTLSINDILNRTEPLTSVNGVWSSCENDDTGSEQDDFTLTDGTASVVTSTFTGADCDINTLAMQETETFTYTLGTLVSIDGSVLGMRNATQFTSTETTVGSEFFGEVEFDLVAISGDRLFFGDTDGLNDGSTEALRAQQLEDITLFMN